MDFPNGSFFWPYFLFSFLSYYFRSKASYEEGQRFSSHENNERRALFYFPLGECFYYDDIFRFDEFISYGRRFNLLDFFFSSPFLGLK